MFFKNLKVQLFIIISITLLTMGIIFFKFDESKLEFHAKFDMPQEWDRTFYGKYRSLLDLEIYDSMQKYKDLSINYRKQSANLFYAQGTKKKIKEDLKIVKSVLLEINKKNFNFSINHNKSVLEKVEKLFNEKINSYKKKDLVVMFYEDYGGSKSNPIKILDNFSLDKYTSVETARSLYELNKDKIENFSIDNMYLYSKTKNKTYLIRTVFLIGLILSFISILLSVKKNRPH